MDEKEFHHLRQVALFERARALAVAEQTYQDRLKALEQTLKLSEVAAARATSPPIRHQRGEIAARVRQAIRSLPEAFSLRDVANTVNADLDAISRIRPERISSAVKRLVGHEIQIEERGAGKRSNKYRKILPKNRPSNGDDQFQNTFKERTDNLQEAKAN